MDNRYIQYAKALEKALNRLYFNSWGQESKVTFVEPNVFKVVIPINHNLQDPNSDDYNDDYYRFTDDVIDNIYLVMTMLGISSELVLKYPYFEVDAIFNHIPSDSIESIVSKIKKYSDIFIKNNYPDINPDDINFLHEYSPNSQSTNIFMNMSPNLMLDNDDTMNLWNEIFETIENNTTISLDDYMLGVSRKG